jgi:uncharacterized membrane protein
MTTVVILVSVLLVALCVLSVLMPWYTRPELFFGVTVLPEFRSTPAALRIVRGYCVGVCAVTVMALAIVLALHRPILALLTHALGLCLTLILAHHAATRYGRERSTAVEVDLRAQPEHMPGGAFVPLLPFAWLVGLGLWAAPNTARLPGRLIVHWGLHGPDRWVATTPGSVLALIGFALFGCVVVAATAYGVLYGSRHISTSGAAARSERQFRRLTVLLALTVEYLIAALPVLFLLEVPRAVMWAWAAALWTTLFVFLTRLVRAGQGGFRMSAPTAHTVPIGDRTDDSRWLGGMFYVNRADPALFVEKRMGIGWTLNFGSVWAWLLLASVFAVPLLLHLALPRSKLDTAQTQTQARNAALTWLGSIDSGDYAHSWDTAATPFRNAVPEAQWVSRISALRSKVGPLKSRSVSSARFAESLPGAPRGEYVVIRFSTSFEHESGATETVTPMKESDGQWRVSGYYVN